MIHLRDLEDEDIHRLFEWRREPEVDYWLYQNPPAAFERHEAWFANFRADPNQVGWVICIDGRPCGFLYLSGLESTQKRAQWGWYIGDAEARGRGAGRAAQALGLDRAFETYDLQKVWSEVVAENETALKAQAAAGFRREGYLRRHSLKHGAYRDVVLLAILREEWMAKRTQVLAGLASSRLIAAS
jgi:UDP-4-amino-4,6-dideoxy-N-acetyl-beta-L-altrosamine N-acetyltransferase